MSKLTTAQLRDAWAPAAKSKGSAFIPAYQALDAILRKYQFDGGKGDTGAFNPRPITGGTDWSLHAYGPGDRFTFWYGATVTTALAVDIDWTNNPYGPVLKTNMPAAMVAEIKALRTNSDKQVWAWGGDYGGNKDAMHFEIVCAPRDLATGIAGAPVPPPDPKPTPTPTTTSKDDDMPVYIINLVPGGQWAGERWLCWPNKTKELVPPSHYAAADTGYGDPVPFTAQDTWDRFKEFYPGKVIVPKP